MSRSSKERRHESSDARFVALIRCFWAVLANVCPDRASRSFCFVARAKGWRAVVSLHPLDGNCGFTARQWEVLELIGRDLRNEGIAEYLGIAEDTVKDHICELMDRTGVRTRAGLVRHSFDEIFTRIEALCRKGVRRPRFDRCDRCLDEFLGSEQVEWLKTAPRRERLLMRTLDGVHATVALAPDEPPPELSPGQSAAVEFVGREFGDAGIASRLDVSESAVKGRLKRAKRAYGVKDRAALVRRVLDDALDDGLDDQRSRASPRRG